MRGQGMSAALLEEALELTNTASRLCEISDQLGCSAETVRQALVAVGVQKQTGERGRELFSPSLGLGRGLLLLLSFWIGPVP